MDRLVAVRRLVGVVAIVEGCGGTAFVEATIGLEKNPPRNKLYT